MEISLFTFCNANSNCQLEKGQQLVSVTVHFPYIFKYNFWNVCFADCTLNVPRVKELKYQISCLQYFKLLHVIYKTGFVGFIYKNYWKSHGDCKYQKYLNIKLRWSFMNNSYWIQFRCSFTNFDMYFVLLVSIKKNFKIRAPVNLALFLMSISQFWK